MNIEKRLETTTTQLCDLQNDGLELIMNIRLANERREASRRIDEDKDRSQLMADLNHETDEATNKLNVIKNRWSDIIEVTDPMDLNDRLQCQNDRINNLLQQKDEIIAELQAALNKASDRYNTDQTKQEADIECLIDRIDEQIEVMKTVYLEHLELLHQSIDGERRTFKLFHSNVWQDLHDERSTNEMKMLTDLLDRNERYYGEIAATQLKHEEINRRTRMKLDQQNNLLQLKLQKVKSEIDLNAEQLNFNYYVLRNRATENILVRNKQKSRLVRMRTCLAAMRKKIHEQNVTQKQELEKRTQQVLSSYGNIEDLEHKMSAFAERNDEKVIHSLISFLRLFFIQIEVLMKEKTIYFQFQHVWQLHESSANSKEESILMIDKIFFEKHLGFQCPKSITCKPDRHSRFDLMQKAIEDSRSEYFHGL